MMPAGLEAILVKGQRAGGPWGAVLVLPATRQPWSPALGSAVLWLPKPTPGHRDSVGPGTFFGARHFGDPNPDTQSRVPWHRAARASHPGLCCTPSCNPKG